MKTRLKDYNNSWYKPGSKIKCLLWYFVNLLFISSKWNPSSIIKIIILRLFGAKIGKGVVIKPGVNVKYPWLLSIGDYSWIGEDVWIDNLASVDIGSNCCISQGAMLLCGNHNYKLSTFDLIVKPISIENGVWIGARSTVCPGVKAKSHSVLSVGSTVAQTMQDFTIYRGNPAVPIRTRNIGLDRGDE